MAYHSLTGCCDGVPFLDGIAVFILDDVIREILCGNGIAVPVAGRNGDESKRGLLDGAEHLPHIHACHDVIELVILNIGQLTVRASEHGVIDLVEDHAVGIEGIFHARHKELSGAHERLNGGIHNEQVGFI